MVEKKLLSIGEAAETIGVSIQTLRRWDANGHFRAAVRTPGGHRLYTVTQIGLFFHDLAKLGFDWAQNNVEIPSRMYCERSPIFQARLEKFKNQLFDKADLQEMAPLIVAVCGEVGDNSFVHNIGNWPDIPGIYFAYDIERRVVVLADRGRGVLATLRPVKPELATHAEALRVAFTEIISGRAPEERGNGLKFVRNIASKYPLGILFQSGNAKVELDRQHPEVLVEQAAVSLRGCIAVIKF